MQHDTRFERFQNRNGEYSYSMPSMWCICKWIFFWPVWWIFILSESMLPMTTSRFEKVQPTPEWSDAYRIWHAIADPKHMQPQAKQEAAERGIFANWLPAEPGHQLWYPHLCQTCFILLYLSKEKLVTLSLVNHPKHHKEHTEVDPVDPGAFFLISLSLFTL